MTMEIRLTKGKVALIDDADYALIEGHAWNAGFTRGWYARTTVGRRPHRKTVLMHNVILPPPTGFVVDHRNRDGLDNRRSNLRIATRSQNKVNSPSQRAHGYKGIAVNGNGWSAYIGPQSAFYLGHFETAVDAALAYDAAAKALYGEFAFLNFPDETLTPWRIKGAKQ